MKIAVLLTVFNRKNKTLACLQRLQQQLPGEGVDIEIFLTDDHSSDGTAEAVKQNFPQVRVYEGTGQLYWAGGMRYTWKQALKSGADYYLLLNDDTMLESNAIATLIKTSTTNIGSPAISIGSTRDEHSGAISYGGWKLNSKKFWKSKRVFEEQKAAACDFGNANIMLVPQAVVNEIGILADHYTHSLADYDYTLKAKKMGFDVYIAPGYLGSCKDDHGNNWKSQNTTLKERIAYLKSPKGLAYNEYLRFIQDHFPLSWPAAFCKLWMKTFFPFIWDRFKTR